MYLVRFPGSPVEVGQGGREVQLQEGGREEGREGGRKEVLRSLVHHVVSPTPGLLLTLLLLLRC